ncbi:MAG TPA: helix-turn-helix transcriptional regulator [Streptosporangiaceae bacterium]
MNRHGVRPEENDIPDLARELRAVRVATGKSLKELERLTASSDSSLSRYLSGSGVPPWPVVEALCRLAQRDPQDLAPLWQAAQRTRVERRSGAGSNGRTTDGPDTGLQPSPGNAAPPGEAAPKHRRRRVLAIGGGAAAVASIAVTAVVVNTLSGGDPAPSGGRVCPWHYVVTDGDPAPVLISDSPEANRKRIGIYEPNQVFYATDPPLRSNGMMKTLDGWVHAGDWIQRYSGPCLNRSDVATSPSSR